MNFDTNQGKKHERRGAEQKRFGESFQLCEPLVLKKKVFVIGLFRNN